MKVTTVTKDGLVRRYCETQDAAPANTLDHLALIAKEREVDGWMLLQCVVLDSSRLGSQVILPYGPGCTFKVPPEHPISPRGLASDMSVVVAVAAEKEEG